MTLKRIVYSLLASLMLVGCQSSVDITTVQKQLTEQAKSVENYHITVKQFDYKDGVASPVSQTVASAAVWQSGMGYGSRIDKTNGEVTNQMEVIAQENRGVIRYYQDPWEETITANSSLQNVVIFPYTSMVAFLQEIDGELSWSAQNGSYQKKYTGDSQTISKALSGKLGLAVPNSSKVTLLVTTDHLAHYLQNVTLRIQDDSQQITKEYQIAYLNINQQQMKDLPKVK